MKADNSGVTCLRAQCWEILTEKAARRWVNGTAFHPTAWARWGSVALQVLCAVGH